MVTLATYVHTGFLYSAVMQAMSWIHYTGVSALHVCMTNLEDHRLEQQRTKPHSSAPGNGNTVAAILCPTESHHECLQFEHAVTSKLLIHTTVEVVPRLMLAHTFHMSPENTCTNPILMQAMPALTRSSAQRTPPGQGHVQTMSSFGYGTAGQLYNSSLHAACCDCVVCSDIDCMCFLALHHPAWAHLPHQEARSSKIICQPSQHLRGSLQGDYSYC